MRLSRIYGDSFKGLSEESWMLSIVMLINRSGSMVLPFLGVYVTDSLNFSIEEAGLVLSFFGIGSVVGSWVGGYLTDKFGEYHIQAFSLFLSTPLFLLIPFFHTIGGMMFIIFSLSSVTEMFRPANSVAITKYAKPGNITRSFSLNRMAINLGFSIGPALGGILSTISYEFLFIMNATTVFVAGIVYVRFFKKRHIRYNFAKKESKKTMPVERKGRGPYRDMPFLVYSFLCVLFSICFFQFLNTIPIFFKEEVHFEQQTIGYILGYTGVFLVIFEMLVVNLAEKYLTLAKTLLLAALLVGVSFGLLALGNSLFLIMFSMTLLCLGEILALPFMSTITVERSDESTSGAYMGLNGMAFAVSFIITPILGTWVAGNYGFNTLWIGSLFVLILVGIGLYGIVHKMLPGK